MIATLNTTVKILAFADATNNSNPRLRQVDWTRDISGVSVQDPKCESHNLLAGASKTIFDGTRTTTLDGTSAFSIALLNIEGASRYRITHTGGTSPTFRTGRSLTPTGMTLVWTVNANATVTLTSSAPLFGGVVAGDVVFVPHTTTGDSANVISVLNAGYWQVLAVSSTQNITLVRLAGQDFEGTTETTVITSNSQLRAFTAAGVQVGDDVDISAGFSTATQKTFSVLAVTDAFVEILSTTPLPAQTGITPSAGGMIFYTETKNFLYVESTQEVVLRLNGDTTNGTRVAPADASDPNAPGMYLKRGPTWSLVVVNRSTDAVDLTVIHSE
jgi:hypothetical protein